MNIEDLQAFLSVAKHGSFSHAAEELHLTQPAISKRIAGLESRLDAQLFDRIGRTINLTEAGRTLQIHAERIINEMEDGRRAITNLTNEIRGQLKMATSHHIGLHRLPPVLRTFTHHYQDVQLDLKFMDSEAACRAIEKGELELAVVTLPLNPPETLKLIEIWQDDFSLITAKDHPLCQQPTFKLSELQNHAAILPAHGTFTRELIDKKLKLDNKSPKAIIETNYLETIKMMVSIGLGWSLLPKTMIDNSLHEYNEHPLNIKRSLGIVLHAQRTLSNAAKAFIDVCMEKQ